MEVIFTDQFDEQRLTHALCFTCEDCAHFDENTETCVHGFPNDMHRRTYYEHVPRPKKVIFCKEFDLL